ncbi:MAG: cryptochrome/photolyase family protein [Simkaniaceae bacterium]|nr:cryptochrome/photolyase family protein [Simkaniaceae bacterium]
MTNLRCIFGDQLNLCISSLRDIDRCKDVVFFFEGMEEFTYVKHHQKKIAFLMSARRHFARELKAKGAKVHYVQLDISADAQILRDALEVAIKEHSIKKLILTEPSEWHLYQEVLKWEKAFSIPVEIREADHFLCSRTEFKAWSHGRKSLIMEYFYREMRKKYDLLMDGKEPIGGQWNYDQENREPLKEGMKPPKPYAADSDTITKEVLDLVSHTFSSHFGDLHPFHFAVDRKGALRVLDQFITERLELFGTYQDAMVQGEAWLYHSHLSFYLNCSVLFPMECIEKAIEAFSKQKVPLNSVEGFIRQILGWREYVRGIYWLKMPQYKKENFLVAKQTLPQFYWTGKTKMNCLKQCITETKAHAYAHHIQRLMVLGNFALLAGINPREVNEWYWIVYADAYEWVELPNVSGMILYADGGLLASKPYAASGAYINRMSDYCKGCYYKVKEKSGPHACPFNYLYWNFLMRNRKKLEKNRRLTRSYRTLEKMSQEKQRNIKEEAQRFFKQLSPKH